MNPSDAAAKAASHPKAGQVMTGAEMIVQVLADEGVDVIFGYSGGAILPTYDAVFRFNQAQAERGRQPMPLIVPANEQGAGFMAAGYARASGRVGVVMVTSGPGATNTVTPVRDCMADSTPIVVICGQVPTRGHRHRCLPGGAGVQLPRAGGQAHLPRHRPGEARGDHAHGVRDRAHRPARAGGGRPAQGRAELDRACSTARASLPVRGYRKRMHAVARSALQDAQAARSSSACWQASKRPLIYAGGGVINGNATEDLRGLPSRLRHSGHHHADGHRCASIPRAAVAAHARHARHGQRQLRGARTAISSSRWARGSTIAWPAYRRSLRRARATSPSSTSTLGNRQGEAGDWRHVGDPEAGPAATLHTASAERIAPDFTHGTPKLPP